MHILLPGLVQILLYFFLRLSFHRAAQMIEAKGNQFYRTMMG